MHVCYPRVYLVRLHKSTRVFPNVLTITIVCVRWCLLPHVLAWSYWPVLLAVERCDRVRTQSSRAVWRLCCRRAKYMSLSKSRTASHSYFLLIYCSTFSQTSKQPNRIIPSEPIQTSEYLTQTSYMTIKSWQAGYRIVAHAFNSSTYMTLCG